MQLAALGYFSVVPSVLNIILGSPRKQFGNNQPLVAEALLGFAQDIIFLNCPGSLLLAGIQTVQKALTN